MSASEPRPDSFWLRVISFTLRYALLGLYLLAISVWLERQFGDPTRDLVAAALGLGSAASLMVAIDAYHDEKTKQQTYSFVAAWRDWSGAASAFFAIAAALLALMPQTHPPG